MKLYARCETCHKNKFFVSKHRLFVPELNQDVTSKVLMCRKCKKVVQKAIHLSHAKTEQSEAN